VNVDVRASPKYKLIAVQVKILDTGWGINLNVRLRDGNAIAEKKKNNLGKWGATARTDRASAGLLVRQSCIPILHAFRSRAWLALTARMQFDSRDANSQPARSKLSTHFSSLRTAVNCRHLRSRWRARMGIKLVILRTFAPGKFTPRQLPHPIFSTDPPILVFGKLCKKY
jgi:hypothetical protein